MKFSIIVPVYNVEKYLKKCIISLFNQDFDNYEIIAINDGSTDNSLGILKELKDQHDNLIIISQENKGLGGARNTGILQARGEYLLFVDSDDYLESNTLSCLWEYINKYNLDILAFDCIKEDTYGKIFEIIGNNNYLDSFQIVSKREFMLFEPTACTKVYRKNIFLDNNILFPEKLWYEDLATVFKLVPYSNKIGYLKQSLYHYVQQSNSITHSKNVKRILEIKRAFEEELNFYKEKQIIHNYYYELEWNCILHVIYYSAYRLLTSSYYKKEMNNLYDYCLMNFPDFKKNPYLKKMKKTKALMNLVVNKRFLLFYCKTGLKINIVNKLKRIIKSDGERL